MKRGIKVIADLSIYPLGEGTSVGRFVKEAYKAMKGIRGIRLSPNPMATVIEADSVDEIFKAVKAAHDAVLAMGAKRVELILRIDDRRDKERIMEDKVRALEDQSPGPPSPRA